MPKVNGNFLHDREVETLINGIDLSRRIMKAAPLANLLGEEVLPGREIGTSREALVDYIRDNAKTALHPTSTCAMGVDSASVTDSQLRVRGVDCLRIADASVLPRVVRGNTTAPVIMIGERAAEFIKKSYAPGGQIA